MNTVSTQMDSSKRLMAACNCLNIIINFRKDDIHSTVDLMLAKANSTPPPPSPLLQLVIYDWMVSVTQPRLVRNNQVGPWNIYQCLFCQIPLYATYGIECSSTLINKSAVTDHETITKLKESDRFSPGFKILLNNIDDSNIEENNEIMNTHPILKDFSDRISEFILLKLKSIEEEIDHFKKLKHLEFEEYKTRIHQDFRIIRTVLDNHNEATLIENYVSNCYSEPLIGENSSTITSTPINKIKIDNTQSSTDVASSKEDSQDSEGIFDLEGMNSPASPHNDHDLDPYNSDIDDSLSRDEGIHIVRNPSQCNMAKSFPINVPAFPQFRGHEDGHENSEDEPHDIAASIKALAQSVHGDVFGDLPRPRFSTQI